MTQKPDNIENAIMDCVNRIDRLLAGIEGNAPVLKNPGPDSKFMTITQQQNEATMLPRPLNDNLPFTEDEFYVEVESLPDGSAFFHFHMTPEVGDYLQAMADEFSLTIEQFVRVQVGLSPDPEE